MNTVKIGLISIMTIILNGCGGGGGSSTSSNEEVEILSTDKNKDLSQYIISSSTDTVFYRKEFVNEDGTLAWFNRFGESSTEPVNNSDEDDSFNKLKVMHSYVNEISRTQTKFTPSLGLDGEDGYFLLADRPSVYLRIGDQKLTKFRESLENELYSDYTILDKYNYSIPRYYESTDSIILNSSNSSRTDTYDACSLTFSPSINLKNITSLALGEYSDVLEFNCVMFSSQNNTELGYRIDYYAKGIGVIHSTTSLNNGVVHHLVKDRKIIENLE